MKKLLPFLLLALSFPSVRAELLVYRESERARVTSSGHEVGVPVTTYWVYDTITKKVDSIGSFKVGPNRYYAITNSTRYLVQKDIAGRLGRYTVLAQLSTTNESPNVLAASYFAKGREVEISFGNGSTTSFPRAFKATTRVVQLVSGHPSFYESSSSVVLVTTETKAANSSGETAAMVIERIRQRLEAQGYTPAP